MADTGSTIYQRIREDVLGGAFGPGAPLLELDLSEHYGVSRTPIREALGRLEHDDLIERGLRGYRVRSGTPSDVLELYETRIPLEELAARLAARRHSSLDLTGLRLLQEQLASSTEPVIERALHTRFHEAIWEAAHNGALRSTLRRLTSQLRIYDQSSSAPDDTALIHAEHEQILAAIANEDSIAAGDRARAHLERTRESRIVSFATASNELPAAR